MSGAQEDAQETARGEVNAAEEARSARARSSLTSLVRIRSGGLRIMRSRKSRIWLVLAIAGPGIVSTSQIQIGRAHV